jgi:hypothetical protein
VRLEQGRDDGRVLHVGGAFVVDDDIEALGVGRVAVMGERRPAAAVVAVDVFDRDRQARLQAGCNDVLLGRVVVAAATGDQKGADGPWRVAGGAGGRHGKGQREAEGAELSVHGFSSSAADIVWPGDRREGVDR